MTTALLSFGRWPSGHDLDIVIHPAPPISRPFPADYDLTETAVTPADLPELGPLVGTLDRLSRTVPVPLDVFLDSKEGFNLALWIEPGRPWLLSWRFCGRGFFLGAHPLHLTQHLGAVEVGSNKKENPTKMTTTPEVSNGHCGHCFNECAECDAYVNAAAEAGAARRYPVIAEHPGFTDYMIRARITQQHPDIAIIRNAYVAGWLDCRAASFITTSVATPSATPVEAPCCDFADIAPCEVRTARCMPL